MNKQGEKIILNVAIGAAAYFFIVVPILKKVGVLKSDEQKTIDNALLGTGNAFDPKYWQTVAGAHILTDSFTNQAIDNIINAFTLFYDNYNAVLSVFKQLNYKTQVSYLAYKFNQKTGNDLLGFLSDAGGLLPWDGLSKEHLSAIVNYANSLPNN